MLICFLAITFRSGDQCRRRRRSRQGCQRWPADGPDALSAVDDVNAAQRSRTARGGEADDDSGAVPAGEGDSATKN